jgi:hypothetical protein
MEEFQMDDYRLFPQKRAWPGIAIPLQHIAV